MDPALERTIREHCEARRFDEAATTALRGYGPVVYRFLLARMRTPDRADDVFAQLCEDLWVGIEGFRWEAAFGTWMHALARNAAHRYSRSPHNQDWRHTTSSRLREAMEHLRTQTAPYLRTEVKDRFHDLRAALTDDEHTLLVLRIDREMGWDEIARIMSDEPLDDLQVKRNATALRQRFTVLKRKLRELAERAGLLGGDE